jgi:23S rRNA (cytidine2498-2'-O)-methyltransferase
VPSEYIVTATPELWRSAFRELQAIAPDLRKIRDFRDGVFLVRSEASGAEFAEAAVRLDPVFVRHLMPVQAEVRLTGLRSADLPALLGAAGEVSDIRDGERFSVQCRHVGLEHDYNAKDVEVFVGSHYERAGAVPVFSDVTVEIDDLQKVVSVYVFQDAGFVGCCRARDNLNEHCDEYRVFSRRPREVSRAEYKLLEAIRKFRLSVSGGRALDLGAAPGGWTWVLADLGMHVLAVDPAELDEKVARLPSVTHLKLRAEEYQGAGDFDLLVNDMNVEPERSAATIVKLAPQLRPGAFAIMTLKLVIRNPDRLIAQVRPILDEAYAIVRMKNLFHNRLEVTLLLRRR